MKSALVKALLLSVVSSVFLSGCGFHMAGNESALPVCQTGNADPLLFAQAKFQCDKKSYQLEIEKLSTFKKEIAISANTNIHQYEFQAELTFNLMAANGKVIDQHKQLIVTKPLIINNNAILSSNIETEVLTKEMNRVLIRRLLRYLKHRLAPQNIPQ